MAGQEGQAGIHTHTVQAAPPLPRDRASGSWLAQSRAHVRLDGRACGEASSALRTIRRIACMVLHQAESRQRPGASGRWVAACGKRTAQRLQSHLTSSCKNEPSSACTASTYAPRRRLASLLQRDWRSSSQATGTAPCTLVRDCRLGYVARARWQLDGAELERSAGRLATRNSRW